MAILEEKEYLIKLSGSDILTLIGVSAGSKEQRDNILKLIEAQVIEQIKQ